MNTHSRLRAALALLVVFAVGDLAAQERDALVDADLRAPAEGWLFGVTGAFSLNMHSGGFRTVPGSETMPLFESGTGSGFQVGLALERIITPALAFDARVMYDNRPGLFTKGAPGVLFLVPGTSNVLTSEPDSTFHSDIDYALVTADFMLTANVVRFSPDVFFVLSAGPSLSVVTNGTMTQWSELRDGRRSTTYADDQPIGGAVGTRLALKGGGGLDVRLGDRLWSHMRAHYDIGLSDVSQHENWQLNTVLFQVDLLYAL